MRPGVCVDASVLRHAFQTAVPSPKAYRDLYDLGIRIARINPPIVDGAKPPEVQGGKWTFDFGPSDGYVKLIAEAKILPYLNPCGCPPAASNGQPAYIGGPGNVAWWPPNAKDDDGTHPEIWAGPDWYNNRPVGGLAGLHPFNQDPARTDTSFDPVRGRVLTGPELAAIDSKMPARPYVVNPPDRDPQYAHDVAEALLEHYGGLAAMIGEGNEPDGDLQSRVNLSWEERFRQVYEPFAMGVRDAQFRNFGNECQIVGVEAASADALALALDQDWFRFHRSRKRTLAGHPLSCIDVASGHLYGQLIDQKYSTLAEYERVLKGRDQEFEFMCGEIDGTPQELYDFTVEMIAKRPSMPIIYNKIGPTFYEPGNAWESSSKTFPRFDDSSLILSKWGLKFQKLFRENR